MVSSLGVSGSRARLEPSRGPRGYNRPRFERELVPLSYLIAGYLWGNFVKESRTVRWVENN
jgi:hypothetical protein